MCVNAQDIENYLADLGGDRVFANKYEFAEMVRQLIAESQAEERIP